MYIYRAVYFWFFCIIVCAKQMYGKYFVYQVQPSGRAVFMASVGCITQRLFEKTGLFI